jgi:hypothetical protein
VGRASCFAEAVTAANATARSSAVKRDIRVASGRPRPAMTKLKEDAGRTGSGAAVSAVADPDSGGRRFS